MVGLLLCQIVKLMLTSLIRDQELACQIGVGSRVPGHLDNKKAKQYVPDFFFMLSHGADYFAEKAAHGFQLPLHVTSGVLFFALVVRKVQLRLVRVLVSHVQAQKFLKKQILPRPPQPTIQDLIQSSAHNFVVDDVGWRCLDCNSYRSKNAPFLRQWLLARCDKLPLDDRHACVPIPQWHHIVIGNQIPHVSHELMSLRGITFCNRCGSFGVYRSRHLGLPCPNRFSVASERAWSKLKNGLLPVPSMRWPQPK